MNELVLQEMSADEVDAVAGGLYVGGLSMSGALDIIGGIGAVCAVIPGLQGAAAFAAGVYIGGKLVMELN